ncbi:hypothetical protein LTR10_020137 [Elasticomyces elasticus]|uniref:Uncharacterized protein n=1 Tax=Exophiala sideris TaxID=1016849 RepID=A0A0D1VTJ0_9EURO|nr:hypothetical protein LTR10_020137 [Elasticomyces elasticus]KAK5021598.1 hypothetical protein LTS07_010895 [Exophiala sideris]KAK5176716.1 hypothetical protein LTR44_010786 [Eurotiomycetes sp. CCFEE 6388]KAK5024769.1 hypothetical protein LTR13_010738 [Exophiala sideris]KAK5049735.1 hypothetical protein LTR69_010919 [Exophiala sideris]
MGNGAKAQQKRDRNEKGAGKEAKSQLKTNVAAQSFKCKTCFSTFQSTTTRKALEEHATNKHSKDYDACFA